MKPSHPEEKEEKNNEHDHFTKLSHLGPKCVECCTFFSSHSSISRVEMQFSLIQFFTFSGDDERWKKTSAKFENHVLK